MSWLKIRKALRALLWSRDRYALLHGVAASLEHTAALKSLPPISTIIDIGANKGQFILEAIKWHPEARIIVFEPLSSERIVMERVLSGVRNLSIEPIALGSENRNSSFYVAGAADSSSLLKQTPLQSQAFPGTANVATESVVIKRLDSVLHAPMIASPVLCKVDVQGYELNVLKGFGDLIRAVDYLIIELSNAPFYDGASNSAEVIAFLAAEDFQILGIYNVYTKDGVGLQADFLLARR